MSDILQLQITEIMATVASLDPVLSDVLYFDFASMHLQRLVAQDKLWEAFRVLSLSCQRVGLSSADDHSWTIARVHEYHDTLMVKLGEQACVAEVSESTANQQGRLLCSLAATARLIRFAFFHNDRSAGDHLLPLLDSLLREVFHTLSDPKVRGLYADLWAVWHRASKKNVSVATSPKETSLRGLNELSSALQKRRTTSEGARLKSKYLSAAARVETEADVSAMTQKDEDDALREDHGLVHIKNRFGRSTVHDKADSQEDNKPRIKTQKNMLSRALLKANQAVENDNEQNVQGAIDAYEEACDILEQVVARSNDPEGRKKVSAIRDTYTTRIAELQNSDSLFPLL